MQLTRLAPLLLLSLMAGCASVGERPSDAALAELAPTANSASASSTRPSRRPSSSGVTLPARRAV